MRTSLRLKNETGLIHFPVAASPAEWFMRGADAAGMQRPSRQKGDSVLAMEPSRISWIGASARKTGRLRGAGFGVQKSAERGRGPNVSRALKRSDRVLRGDRRAARCAITDV